MVLRGVNSRAALLLCLLVAGCAGITTRILRHVPPGAWTEALGDARRAPFAAEHVPEAPSERWQRGLDRGIVHPPIVAGYSLMILAGGRALSAASAEDGRRYWSRRFNGPVVGTPLRQGARVYVGTASREGRVYAYALPRGKQRWRARLRAPMAGEPLLAGDRLVLGSNRAELSALDTADGAVRWRARTPGVPVGAPVLDGESVLVGTARDTLIRVALRDGQRLATRALPGTPSAPPARTATTLLVPIHPGAIAHLALPGLELLRVDTLGSPVLAAPAVAADGSAYVLTRAADVWRIDAAAATRIAALGGAARESLTLAANGLLVGRLDGTLFFLRHDGSEVWRRKYDGSLRAPVVLRGGTAWVALYDGEVVRLQ